MREKLIERLFFLTTYIIIDIFYHLLFFGSIAQRLICFMPIILLLEIIRVNDRLYRDNIHQTLCNYDFYRHTRENSFGNGLLNDALRITVYPLRAERNAIAQQEPE